MPCCRRSRCIARFGATGTSATSSALRSARVRFMRSSKRILARRSLRYLRDNFDRAVACDAERPSSGRHVRRDPPQQAPKDIGFDWNIAQDVGMYDGGHVRVDRTLQQRTMQLTPLYERSPVSRVLVAPIGTIDEHIVRGLRGVDIDEYGVIGLDHSGDVILRLRM